jgi:putative transposase
MALAGYKSNDTVVYSRKCHGVWPPKYRRAVLAGPMAIPGEQVSRQVAAKYQAEIIAREILPDQLYLRVEVDPLFGIPTHHHPDQR